MWHLQPPEMGVICQAKQTQDKETSMEILINFSDFSKSDMGTGYEAHEQRD